jgi:adenylate cyclase class 2
MEEIEIKFLEINPELLEKQLLEFGAKKVGEYHYRRIVFDYPDFRLDKQSAWLRLRDEGDKITFTFKQRLGINNRDTLSGDEGMYERETTVGDFDATREILLKAGFIEKMYQENKRTRYLLDGVECDIDTWPLLPPYLELEGKNWEEVYAVAAKLGFKREDAKMFSTNQIYRLQGLDDRNYTKLTFDEQIERKENRF